MQILIKIVVTSIAGGVAYLLTNVTKQPEVWQITMSVFVAGVVLVVQFLIDVAEQSRQLAEAIRVEGAKQSQELIASVSEISEAATHLAAAENRVGRDSVIRLVESAGRMDPEEALQRRFTHRQIADLADLIDGLRSGRAEHEGEDPDWLLGLTETAITSIDATSMTSFERHRGLVDEGEFWESDLGLRYLDRQRQAIERKVRIRRLFLLTEDATDVVQLEKLLEPHRKISVETRILRPENVYFLYQNDLEDFIIFDQQISYEFHTSRTLKKNVTPLIANVALVVDPRLVKKRRDRFEELWDAAEPREDEPTP
ncbi:DUF6879 family protein [Paractinoplanes atraurantiacus]|uniref:DUF6879 domain-containing protein n=1 Tax=Paractinoplanes atraurantiacus TaxID=1036182 RepID=A0A285ILZ9_9ACTN|nr:DUF6879 family protein [Actinoplanes atraurantiacus]SNY49025.1 hypothetical protein SAMN05421748_109190 [Actinoplanes atraurantiacus]